MLCTTSPFEISATSAAQKTNWICRAIWRITCSNIWERRHYRKLNVDFVAAVESRFVVDRAPVQFWSIRNDLSVDNGSVLYGWFVDHDRVMVKVIFSTFDLVMYVTGLMALPSNSPTYICFWIYVGTVVRSVSIVTSERWLGKGCCVFMWILLLVVVCVSRISPRQRRTLKFILHGRLMCSLFVFI